MATIRYKTRVRANGLLPIPKTAKEQLHLRPGDTLDVSIERRLPVVPTKHQSVINPLAQVIGIGVGGKADGAEQHDRDLYSA